MGKITVNVNWVRKYLCLPNGKDVGEVYRHLQNCGFQIFLDCNLQ